MKMSGPDGMPQGFLDLDTKSAFLELSQHHQYGNNSTPYGNPMRSAYPDVSGPQQNGRPNYPPFYQSGPFAPPPGQYGNPADRNNFVNQFQRSPSPSREGKPPAFTRNYVTTKAKRDIASYREDGNH